LLPATLATKAQMAVQAGPYTLVWFGHRISAYHEFW